MCGKAPSVPPPPPPSAQELALMEKQGKLLDMYQQSIEDTKKQNKELGLITAITSGMYDPVYEGGVLVDAKLNPAKVAALQEDFNQNEEINRLLNDRYERALKGELPVSEALLNQKKNDFTLLRERAAKMGINIQGTSLDEAATTPQNSTSGNELTSRLYTTYKLAEDAERRGELSTAPPVIGANRLALATGGVSAYGPGATLGAEAAGVNLVPGVLQPYQTQRQLEYSRNVNNAALRSQQRAAYINGISQTIGNGIGAYAAFA